VTPFPRQSPCVFWQIKGIFKVATKTPPMVIRKESASMASSPTEQYIVDEKGNPTAVILPIKEYKKMLSMLEEVEDQRESKILSQSPEFKKLVKKGLEDIKADRIKHWKEVWDDL
jgi:PHD/YefM family antitoxin component YafN of YafNO toxin-antitoxin module